jgi:hypothetical protein
MENAVRSKPIEGKVIEGKDRGIGSMLHNATNQT